MKKFLLVLFICLGLFTFIGCENEPEEEKTSFSISYDLDGGTVTGLVEVFEKNENVVLPTPQKDGFNFLGWYDGEIKVEVLEEKDYTLKAKWEKITVLASSLKIMDGTKECNSLTLKEKETKTLTIEVLPENADNKNVLWESSNKEVATVNEGLITAVSAGNVTITAKLSENSTIKATVTIQVESLDKLGAFKASEKNKLDGWFSDFFDDETIYSETNWKIILGFVVQAKSDIDAAADETIIAGIVKDVKNDLFAVLTIEDEAAARLKEAVEKAKEDLVKLSNSIIKSEYNIIDYAQIQNLISAAQLSLDNCETVEAVTTLYDEVIVKVNAFSKLLTITYENIEMATWGYSSYDEIIADFSIDYKAKSTYEANNKWAGQSNDILKVFTETEGKWIWLLDYWAAVNPNGYSGLTCKQAFQDFKANLSLGSIDPYYISTESAGFVTKSQVSVYTGGLKCADYTDKEIRDCILDYIKPRTGFTKGESFTLSVPDREFQDFLGWYDNELFNGEAITEITAEVVNSIILYAKWTDISAADQFTLDVRAAQKELENYLKTFDRSVYNDATWKNLENLVVTGKVNIGKVTNKEELTTALSTEKGKLDSVLPNIFTVTYVLNGGHWDYATHDEIASDLLADYTKFKGSSMTKDNFFSSSYSGTDDKKITAFFKNNVRWQWLLTYFAENCDEANKGKFDLNTALDEPQVRIEIMGFLQKKSVSDSSYTSADYSLEDKLNKVFDYINYSEFSYLDATTKLPTPIKFEYAFKGWYKEDTFVTKVESVDRTCTLYAKFEFITSDVKLTLNKENATTELNQYYNELTKDSNKYSLENSNTLKSIKDTAIQAINNVSASETDPEGLTALTAIVDKAKTDLQAVPNNEVEVTFVLNDGHWYYGSREEMVDDFITDAMAKYNKTGDKPNCMNSDSAGVEGALGFTNVFSEKIYEVFTDAKYASKWAWLKDYILSVSKDSTLTELQNKNETFWRYSLGAFLFKDMRDSWPVSTDFRVEENYDGFWEVDYFKKNSETYISETTLPTPYLAGYTFVGWFDNPDLNGTAITSFTGYAVLKVKEITYYAKWEKVE